jgi:hypothetical protein
MPPENVSLIAAAVSALLPFGLHPISPGGGCRRRHRSGAVAGPIHVAGNGTGGRYGENTDRCKKSSDHCFTCSLTPARKAPERSEIRCSRFLIDPFADRLFPCRAPLTIAASD